MAALFADDVRLPNFREIKKLMPKTKNLTCEICSLPDGVPSLKLVEIETEHGNYYSCPACLLQEQIEEVYHGLGRLLDKQHFYFRSLSRHYWKRLKNHD